MTLLFHSKIITYTVPYLKPARRKTDISGNMFIFWANGLTVSSIVMPPCGGAGVFAGGLEHTVELLQSCGDEILGVEGSQCKKERN